MPAGEILAIAKDWPQRLRHRTLGRTAAEQILVDPVGLQRAVQPPRPPRIAMAVAQERAIDEWRDLRHGCHLRCQRKAAQTLCARTLADNGEVHIQADRGESRAAGGREAAPACDSQKRVDEYPVRS